jgi:hypothetical protein
MDTETGEGQEMTTPTDEEGKGTLRKYFKDKQQSLIEQKVVLKDKFEQTEEDPVSLTPFRSHMMLAYVMTSDLCDIFELLRLFSEDSFELAKYLRNREAKLDAIIKEIRNQGIDLSKVKTEVESFKTSANPTAMAKISKFAEDFNKHVEDTKKDLEEYKKKMKENNLAE